MYRPLPSSVGNEVACTFPLSSGDGLELVFTYELSNKIVSMGSIFDVSPGQLLNVLNSYLKSNNSQMSKSQFDTVIRRLTPHVAKLDEESRYYLSECFSTLYKYSRVGTESALSMNVLISLLVVCRGSKSEKLFALWNHFAIGSNEDIAISRVVLMKIIQGILCLLQSNVSLDDIEEASLSIVEKIYSLIPSDSLNQSSKSSAISLSQFGSVFNQFGSDVMPFLELIDWRKWPTVQMTTSVADIVYNDLTSSSKPNIVPSRSDDLTATFSTIVSSSVPAVIDSRILPSASSHTASTQATSSPSNMKQNESLPPSRIPPPPLPVLIPSSVDDGVPKSVNIVNSDIDVPKAPLRAPSELISSLVPAPSCPINFSSKESFEKSSDFAPTLSLSPLSCELMCFVASESAISHLTLSDLLNLIRSSAKAHRSPVNKFRVPVDKVLPSLLLPNKEHSDIVNEVLDSIAFELCDSDRTLDWRDLVVAMSLFSSASKSEKTALALDMFSSWKSSGSTTDESNNSLHTSLLDRSSARSLANGILAVLSYMAHAGLQLELVHRLMGAKYAKHPDLPAFPTKTLTTDEWMSSTFAELLRRELPTFSTISPSERLAARLSRAAAFSEDLFGARSPTAVMNDQDFMQVYNNPGSRGFVAILDSFSAGFWASGRSLIPLDRLKAEFGITIPEKSPLSLDHILMIVPAHAKEERQEQAKKTDGGDQSVTFDFQGDTDATSIAEIRTDLRSPAVVIASPPRTTTALPFQNPSFSPDGATNSINEETEDDRSENEQENVIAEEDGVDLAEASVRDGYGDFDHSTNGSVNEEWARGLQATSTLNTSVSSALPAEKMPHFSPTLTSSGARKDLFPFEDAETVQREQTKVKLYFRKDPAAAARKGAVVYRCTPLTFLNSIVYQFRLPLSTSLETDSDHLSFSSLSLEDSDGKFEPLSERVHNLQFSAAHCLAFHTLAAILSSNIHHNQVLEALGDNTEDLTQESKLHGISPLTLFALLASRAHSSSTVNTSSLSPLHSHAPSAASLSELAREDPTAVAPLLLGRDGYTSVLMSLLPSDLDWLDGVVAAESALQAVFSALDRSGSGMVPLRDIAVALLPLCRASKSEKLALVWQWYGSHSGRTGTSSSSADANSRGNGDSASEYHLSLSSTYSAFRALLTGLFVLQALSLPLIQREQHDFNDVSGFFGTNKQAIVRSAASAAGDLAFFGASMYSSHSYIPKNEAHGEQENTDREDRHGPVFSDFAEFFNKFSTNIEESIDFGVHPKSLVWLELLDLNKIPDAVDLLEPQNGYITIENLNSSTGNIGTSSTYNGNVAKGVAASAPSVDEVEVVSDSEHLKTLKAELNSLENSILQRQLDATYDASFDADVLSEEEEEIDSTDASNVKETSAKKVDVSNMEQSEKLGVNESDPLVLRAIATGFSLFSPEQREAVLDSFGIDDPLEFAEFTEFASRRAAALEHNPISSRSSSVDLDATADSSVLKASDESTRAVLEHIEAWRVEALLLGSEALLATLAEQSVAEQDLSFASTSLDYAQNRSGGRVSRLEESGIENSPGRESISKRVPEPSKIPLSPSHSHSHSHYHGSHGSYCNSNSMSPLSNSSSDSETVPDPLIYEFPLIAPGTAPVTHLLYNDKSAPSVLGPTLQISESDIDAVRQVASVNPLSHLYLWDSFCVFSEALADVVGSSYRFSASKNGPTTQSNEEIELLQSPLQLEEFAVAAAALVTSARSALQKDAVSPSDRLSGLRACSQLSDTLKRMYTLATVIPTSSSTLESESGSVVDVQNIHNSNDDDNNNGTSGARVSSSSSLSSSSADFMGLANKMGLTDIFSGGDLTIPGPPLSYFLPMLAVLCNGSKSLKLALTWRLVSGELIEAAASFPYTSEDSETEASFARFIESADFMAEAPRRPLDLQGLSRLFASLLAGVFALIPSACAGPPARVRELVDAAALSGAVRVISAVLRHRADERGTKAAIGAGLLTETVEFAEFARYYNSGLADCEPGFIDLPYFELLNTDKWIGAIPGSQLYQKESSRTAEEVDNGEDYSLDELENDEDLEGNDQNLSFESALSTALQGEAPAFCFPLQSISISSPTHELTQKEARDFVPIGYNPAPRVIVSVADVNAFVAVAEHSGLHRLSTSEIMLAILSSARPFTAVAEEADLEGEELRVARRSLLPRSLGRGSASELVMMRSEFLNTLSALSEYAKSSTSSPDSSQADVRGESELLLAYGNSLFSGLQNHRIGIASASDLALAVALVFGGSGKKIQKLTDVWSVLSRLQRNNVLNSSDSENNSFNEDDQRNDEEDQLDIAAVAAVLRAVLVAIAQVGTVDFLASGKVESVKNYPPSDWGNNSFVSTPETLEDPVLRAAPRTARLLAESVHASSLKPSRGSGPLFSIATSAAILLAMRIFQSADIDLSDGEDSGDDQSDLSTPSEKDKGKTRRGLTLADFAEVYNSWGWTNMGFLELLDIKKWVVPESAQVFLHYEINTERSRELSLDHSRLSNLSESNVRLGQDGRRVLPTHDDSLVYAEDDEDDDYNATEDSSESEDEEGEVEEETEETPMLHPHHHQTRHYGTFNEEEEEEVEEDEEEEEEVPIYEALVDSDSEDGVIAADSTENVTKSSNVPPSSSNLNSTNPNFFNTSSSLPSKNILSPLNSNPNTTPSTSSLSNYSKNGKGSPSQNKASKDFIHSNASTTTAKSTQAFLGSEHNFNAGNRYDPPPSDEYDDITHAHGSSSSTYTVHSKGERYSSVLADLSYLRQLRNWANSLSEEDPHTLRDLLVQKFGGEDMIVSVSSYKYTLTSLISPDYLYPEERSMLSQSFMVLYHVVEENAKRNGRAGPYAADLIAPLLCLSNGLFADRVSEVLHLIGGADTTRIFEALIIPEAVFRNFADVENRLYSLDSDIQAIIHLFNDFTGFEPYYFKDILDFVIQYNIGGGVWA